MPKYSKNKRGSYSYSKALPKNRKIIGMTMIILFVVVLVVGTQTDMFSAFITEEGYTFTMDFSGLSIEAAGLTWTAGTDVNGITHEEGSLIANPDGLPPSSAMTVSATGLPKYEFILTDFIFLDATGAPTTIPEPYDSTITGDNKISYYKVYFSMKFQTITEYSESDGIYGIDTYVKNMPSLDSSDKMIVTLSGSTSAGNAEGMMLIHGAELIGLEEDYATVGDFGTLINFEEIYLPLLADNPNINMTFTPIVYNNIIAEQGVITTGMGDIEVGLNSGSMTIEMVLAPGATVYDDGTVNDIEVVGQYDFSVVVGVYSSLYDKPVFSIGNRNWIFSTEQPLYLMIALVLVIVSIIGIFLFVRTKTVKGTEFFKERIKASPPGTTSL